jgi:hypothetical protein
MSSKLTDSFDHPFHFMHAIFPAKSNTKAGTESLRKVVTKKET